MCVITSCWVVEMGWIGVIRVIRRMRVGNGGTRIIQKHKRSCWEDKSLVIHSSVHTSMDINQVCNCSNNIASRDTETAFAGPRYTQAHSHGHHPIPLPPPPNPTQMESHTIHQHPLRVLSDEPVRPGRGGLCEWEVLDGSEDAEDFVRAQGDHVRCRPDESESRPRRLHHYRVGCKDDPSHRDGLCGQVVGGRRRFVESVPVEDGGSGKVPSALD